MKFSILFLIIGAAIATSSCASQSRNLAAEREKEVEIEIGRQIENLRRAWANLDATAVASFFSERSRDTYNGERLSYTELLDWAAAGYTDISGTDIGPFEDFRIDVLSADAAVASWHNTVNETWTAGADPVQYRAFMTQVWVREGNDWRILHNHESTLDFGNPDQVTHVRDQDLPESGGRLDTSQ